MFFPFKRKRKWKQKRPIQLCLESKISCWTTSFLESHMTHSTKCVFCNHFRSGSCEYCVQFIQLYRFVTTKVVQMGEKELATIIKILFYQSFFFHMRIQLRLDSMKFKMKPCRLKSEYIFSLYSANSLCTFLIFFYYFISIFIWICIIALVSRQKSKIDRL